MLFTSPNSFPSGFNKVPDFETLKSLVNRTIEESQSIRRFTKSQNENFTTRLICYAIEDLEWILNFFTATNPIYLNELSITRRKFLEIYIDLFWVYTFFKEGNIDIVEELSKRYYQVGANDFLKLQSGNKNSNDIFFTDSDIIKTQDESLDKAKNANHIELDPYNGEHDYSNLFKSEWRAHPKLFGNKKIKRTILSTRERAKYIREFVSSFTGLKNPPFYQDYDRLNQITHWTVFGLRPMSEKQKILLHNREINLMLGYLHDCINLIYDYVDRDVPESVIMIRQEFIYST
jgi:hypothetical protein